MEKLTAEQIIDIVENKLEMEVDSFAEGYYNIPDDFIFSEETQKQTEYLRSVGLGQIELVDSYGGEGQGETYYVVQHFVDHDVYIRTEGYYSSYCGVEWYNGYGTEVRPVQVTVTQYKPIEK